MGKVVGTARNASRTTRRQSAAEARQEQEIQAQAERLEPMGRQLIVDLLEGRKGYDPEKHESWIVLQVAATRDPSSLQAERVDGAQTLVDVLGLNLEPESVEEAQLSVYAIMAAVETLHRYAGQVIGRASRRHPAILKMLERSETQLGLLGTDGSPVHPTDQPFYG
jgi:hypothetical protein